MSKQPEALMPEYDSKRAEFDEWARAGGLPILHEGGRYMDYWTHTAWRAWQAREPEVERLQDVLLRNGFARCNIPACNCGSWHHRYGFPERWQEIKDALAEADHPLSNENGNTVRNALAQLVAERDALREQVRALREALMHCVTEEGPEQDELNAARAVLKETEGAK